MSRPTQEQKNHWTKVAELGCILTRGPAEIAHCHGGSIKLLGPEFQPGVAQRQNHWLVIPLSPIVHRGTMGLDTWSEGVSAWEDYWGQTQIELLQEVSDRLGYSVFEKAGVPPDRLSDLAPELPYRCRPVLGQHPEAKQD